MALTQKQEAFVVKYLECDNATEAYKFAYDCENTSDAVKNKEASILLKNRKIAVRVKELKADINREVLSKVVIDRTFVTNGILDTITKADSEGDRTNTLKGLDMLGKMYDLNEDKQNDRLVSNKDRTALLDNFKQRIINVTPDES